MEFSFMTQVNATKEKVWEYYEDIQKWYVWENDLKNITLTDGFKAGSCGVMELVGMPPMTYLLTAVTTAKEFWDKTDTPFGSIYFGHEIICKDDTSVYVKHTVRLETEKATDEAMNFLKQVFSDVPDAILSLKNAVEDSGCHG